MKGLGYEQFPSSDEKTKPNTSPASNSGTGTGGAKTSGGKGVFGKGYADPTGRFENLSAPKLKDGTTYA